MMFLGCLVLKDLEHSRLYQSLHYAILCQMLKESSCFRVYHVVRNWQSVWAIDPQEKKKPRNQCFASNMQLRGMTDKKVQNA
jgi:hypothetical protein